MQLNIDRPEANPRQHGNPSAQHGSSEPTQRAAVPKLDGRVPAG